MKKLSIFLIGYLVHFHSQSQEHLINYYSKYTEVHGGMSDGGITRQEQFYFSVSTTIELQDIWYNNRPLILQKGDTLVICFAHFTSYNPQETLTQKTATSYLEKTDQKIMTTPMYNVFWDGRYYFAQSQANWNNGVSYCVQNKRYISKTKGGFDSGTTSYAP